MKKVALHTLGCKVNSYETEAMSQLLEKAGFSIVPFSDVADIYIVNTCSVTNIADRKSRQMLHKAKKKNPDAIVIAAGCYAQTDTDGARDDVAVDIVVGNNKKINIVEIINDYFEKHISESLIDINETDEYETLELTEKVEHTRAHIKIQDGCNNFCAYCIIPYARGRNRSRYMKEIKAEAERLAEIGYKEIVLTGINLSAYDDAGQKLIDVCEMLNEVDGIERIRISSLDPVIVDEIFAKRLAKCEKICPHFHLSLQSGCDKTLKAMNRHYTADDYYEKCKILRKYFPDVAFTTDIIVGFPGETEEDYKECRDFAQKVGFAMLHVFKYSRRNGTVAADMPEQVDEQVKSKRSDDLIKVGEAMREEYLKNQLGKQKAVLFEEEVEIDGEKYWVGHTKDYIQVAVKSDEIIAGGIKDVNLEKIAKNQIILATL